MSKFIDEDIIAVARTTRGTEFTGKRIRTATHLLDVTAEAAAIVRAVHANEPDVCEVETTMKGRVPVMPLVLTMLADHAARTGVPITHRIRGAGGEVVFESDVERALPFYKSPLSPLSTLARRRPSPAVRSGSSIGDLKTYAKEGIVRNFPVRDAASGYGAAVLLSDGSLYFGGQYSAPDERLGMHAEMAVLVNALLGSKSAVTDIGIVSTKFKEAPTNPCGACRQFLAELLGEMPTVHLFAYDSNAVARYTLAELLPVQWDNHGDRE